MKNVRHPNAQVNLRGVLIFPLFYFVWWDKIIPPSAFHKIQFMWEDLFWRTVRDRLWNNATSLKTYAIPHTYF